VNVGQERKEGFGLYLLKQGRASVNTCMGYF